MSAAQAFQTRPLANAANAARFSVTVRSIQRWLANLESLGRIGREYRKNPHIHYKNLRNRVRFDGFCTWFKRKLQATPDNLCLPRKKSKINQLPLKIIDIRTAPRPFRPLAPSPTIPSGPI